MFYYRPTDVIELFILALLISGFLTCVALIAGIRVSKAIGWDERTHKRKVWAVSLIFCFSVWFAIGYGLYLFIGG